MRRILPWVAVLTLGCAQTKSGAIGPPEPSPPMLDHPRVTACRASAPACHEAAWKALRGEGGLTGDWVGAAFLLAGCEAGYPPSCGDLAALHAAGRGVPRDDRRACELGLSEACARLGRSGPIVAAVTSAPLPPPAPASLPPPLNPADAEAYADWAWSLYPELHEPLGLTRDALAVTPPAPPAERALLDLVVARRMPAVQACAPAAVVWSETTVEKTVAVATFTVGQDGRPARPVVRVPAGAFLSGAASWSRCGEELIAGWTLPLAPSGGRFWLTFAGLGPPVTDEHPAPGAPVHALDGYTKPTMREPRCVQDSIQLPYKLLGFVSGPITVLFAVGPDGEPGRFKVLTRRVPPGITEAIWRAVKGCEWRPGRSPDGTPTRIWVVLPLRFSSG
jgi:hypothetical protein